MKAGGECVEGHFLAGVWRGWSGGTADNWQDQWDFKLRGNTQQLPEDKGLGPPGVEDWTWGAGKEVCWGGAIITIPLISEGI